MKTLLKQCAIIIGAILMLAACGNEPKEPKDQLAFDIEISNITYQSADLNIKCTDTNQLYILQVANDELLEMYGSIEGCVESYIEYLLENCPTIGALFGLSSMEDILYLMGYGYRGDSEITLSNLESSMDYILFVVALNPEDFTYSALTTKNFTTEESPEMSFRFTMNGDSVNIFPSGDHLYLYSQCTAKQMEEAGTTELLQYVNQDFKQIKSSEKLQEHLAKGNISVPVPANIQDGEIFYEYAITVDENDYSYIGNAFTYKQFKYTNHNNVAAKKAQNYIWENNSRPIINKK